MSKTIRPISAITAFLLFFSLGVANAQDGFNSRFSQDFDYSWSFTGGGARALGMGNAYTAMADDYFSFGWNPANVSGVKKIYLGIENSRFLSGGDYKFGRSTSTLPTAQKPISLGHSADPKDYFGGAGVAIPADFKGRTIVFGASYTRRFDTYARFAEKIFPTGQNTTDLEIERSGSLNSFNFGLAIPASEKLSVGISGNIYTGRVLVEQNTIEAYANSFYEQSGQAILLAREVQEFDSLSLSGFNVTLGARFTMDEASALALVVRTPFRMKINNDVRLHRIVTSNGSTAPTNLDVGSDTLINPDVESRVKMPLTMALGYTRSLNDDFLLSADLEYGHFSGSDLSILDSSRQTASGLRENFFHKEPANYANTLQLRIGGEYELSTNLGKVPLRAGLGYLPQPFRDVTDYAVFYNSRIFPFIPGYGVSPASDTVLLASDAIMLGNEDIDILNVSFGDQVKAYSVSLGAGLHSVQRKLDFGYSLSWYTRHYRTPYALTMPAYFSEQRPIFVPPYQYLYLNTHDSEDKVMDHKFSISFTGYF